MIKLYRAVSQAEKDDYDRSDRFNIARNTLEAKQFFKSHVAVIQFVKRSVLQIYDPPYLYVLITTVDVALLHEANPDDRPLDGFEAITIAEDDLNAFNNCIIFVKGEKIWQRFLNRIILQQSYLCFLQKMVVDKGLFTIIFGPPFLLTLLTLYQENYLFLTRMRYCRGQRQKQ